jgi:hypothetical protein
MTPPPSGRNRQAPEPYSLTAAQRYRVLENFKSYAAAPGVPLSDLVRELPEEVVDLLVRSLQAAYAPASSPWHDLYVRELERLLDLAEAARKPEAYLRELPAFAALGHDADGPLQRRIRALLLQKVHALDSRVRHAVVTLLHHFILRTHHDAIRVVSAMRYDETRKVRMQAFALLNALQGRHQCKDMPYLDQLPLRLAEWFDEL